MTRSKVLNLPENTRSQTRRPDFHTSTNKKNNMELQRLETFEKWPKESQVHPTSLARGGMYYTGTGDTTKCFMCGVEINNWRRGDQPLHKHKRFSPRCSFINGELTDNIPFETDSLPFSLRRLFSMERRCQNTYDISYGFDTDYDEVKTMLDEHYRTLLRKYPFVITKQLIMDARTKNLKRLANLCGNSASAAEEICDEVLSLQENGGNMNRNSHGTPQNLEGSLSRLTLETISSTSNTRTRTNHLVEYCDPAVLPQLVTTAQHPDYVNIESRYETFLNWPRSYLQNPKVLSEAGFFYTGEEDRVKCFMCNGGLCNWDTDDIPWVEHHRWFGNCSYVKHCKQNPVVAAILDTAQQFNSNPVLTSHHHHQHTGRTQCDRPPANQVTPNLNATSVTTNKTQDPPEKETPTTLTYNNDTKQQSKDTDLHSLREENVELKSRKTCKVCLQNDIEVIFLPCSHLACCLECSLQLQECPLCRSTIKATARVHI